MYLKPLAKSERLRMLEALKCRVPESHPKSADITYDLIKLRSGYKGEKTVKYYLDFLPEKEYLIIHNRRLPSGIHHFQMDFLILTTRFVLIVESKNILGELHFDSSFNQLIRKHNEQEEGFPDPVLQVKWHQKQLRGYIPKFPIETLAIMSNPSSIIKANPGDKEITRIVIRSQSLLERIEEMDGKYQKELLDRKQLRKLGKQLLKCHVPEDMDLIKYYGLQNSEIVPGVQCPNCQHIPMIRHKKKWFCKKCNHFSKDAHEQAIQDYLLLINPTITNQQFREFTHVSSVFTANRMLTSTNLVSTAQTRGEDTLFERGGFRIFA